jgi:hypothetical protein
VSFAQLSLGNSHGCGVDLNNNIVCWGYSTYGETMVPGVAFKQAAQGCGLRSDGSVSCWPSLSSPSTVASYYAPAGSYQQVTVGQGAFGIKTDGTIGCLGTGTSCNVATLPSGVFTQISSGMQNNTCAVGTSGAVTCWPQTGAPPLPGVYVQVSVGRSSTCGIKTDGSLACWGSNTGNDATPPAGSFTQVVEGWEMGCGLQSNQSIVCWGTLAAEEPAPAGTFTQVALGEMAVCGLGAGGTISCSAGQKAPAGIFTNIAGGWTGDMYGVRDDGAIVGWTSSGTVQEIHW